MASDSTRCPIPSKRPLGRGSIARHQRERIVVALVEEISERGYQAVTIADVVERAAVSRDTFYENFSSKESCFLEAQQFAISSALERVVEAAGQAEKWPDQVAAGLAAFLEYAVENETLARTCMIEGLVAGPASISRHEEALQMFASLFKLGRSVSPFGEELPEMMEEAIVGGIFWIVYQRLTGCSVEGIEQLLPQMVEFALTPYFGAGTTRAKKLAG